jgi:hypothetical protein
MKGSKNNKDQDKNRQASSKEERELRSENEYIDMSGSSPESSSEIADRANLLYDETAGEAFSGDVMGEQADINPVSDINSFEDPVEADINERLKLGFALERPEQGDLGEEDEYIGDLPDGQLRMGNRYDPSVSTGNPGGTGLEMPGDMDVHIKDENEIGMAFGPDNYVNNEDDDFEGSEDGEGGNQSIH